MNIWTTKQIKIQIQIPALCYTMNWNTFNVITLHFIQRVCKLLHAIVCFAKSKTGDTKYPDINVINVCALLKCDNRTSLTIGKVFDLHFQGYSNWTATDLSLETFSILYHGSLVSKEVYQQSQWEKTTGIIFVWEESWIEALCQIQAAGAFHFAAPTQSGLAKYFHSYLQIPVWLKSTK